MKYTKTLFLINLCFKLWFHLLIDYLSDRWADGCDLKDIACIKHLVSLACSPKFRELDKALPFSAGSNFCKNSEFLLFIRMFGEIRGAVCMNLFDRSGLLGWDVHVSHLLSCPPASRDTVPVSSAHINCWWVR